MLLISRMGKFIMVHAYKGYYSALKGNELLVLATTGMNFKSITLNEKSHTRKTVNVGF